MGFHTFDSDQKERLEDPTRYQYLSVDELLELLVPTDDATILDLGSGTGFYTDAIAPYAGQVVGADLQPAMLREHRANGVPENVALVAAAADALPVPANTFDGVLSTMTYHEFVSDAALAELARVLVPGGRLAIADWTATGEGAAGPPRSERFTVEDAVRDLRAAGFEIVRSADRRETFVVAATH
jgi:ubiquinone/menaquinone biosynthesis C-methylase UbiE